MIENPTLKLRITGRPGTGKTILSGVVAHILTSIGIGFRPDPEIEGEENLVIDYPNPDQLADLSRLQFALPSTGLHNRFEIGDSVEKFTGEALWEGVVVSAYITTKGSLRYVVEVMPQGFQMIAVPSQLRPLKKD